MMDTKRNQRVKLSSRLLAIGLGIVVAWQNFAFAAAEPVELVMETEMGTVELELYPDQAPITVENFLKYVDTSGFDGAEFYRLVTYENDNGNPKIEVIQGGLNGKSREFEPIAHESTEQTGLLHTDGVISMARGEVGTASSEFFICVGDQPGLDFGQPRNADGQGFAAFGKVTTGMEVIRRINKLDPGRTEGEGYTAGQILTEPVLIISVKRK